MRSEIIPLTHYTIHLKPMKKPFPKPHQWHIWLLKRMVKNEICLPGHLCKKEKKERGYEQKLTFFSLARYTLPNFPRPRGFPMSKSLRVQRLSSFLASSFSFFWEIWACNAIHNQNKNWIHNNWNQSTWKKSIPTVVSSGMALTSGAITIFWIATKLNEWIGRQAKIRPDEVINKTIKWEAKKRVGWWSGPTVEFFDPKSPTGVWRWGGIPGVESCYLMERSVGSGIGPTGHGVRNIYPICRMRVERQGRAGRWMRVSNYPLSFISRESKWVT